MNGTLKLYGIFRLEIFSLQTYDKNLGNNLSVPTETRPYTYIYLYNIF